MLAEAHGGGAVSGRRSLQAEAPALRRRRCEMDHVCNGYIWRCLLRSQRSQPRVITIAAERIRQNVDASVEPETATSMPRRLRELTRPMLENVSPTTRLHACPRSGLLARFSVRCLHSLLPGRRPGPGKMRKEGAPKS
ncbi:hypothetical protein AK812_SmicGene39915 [Symbiodinium microadriaticum]|uniref:Uncharacterized protein n=1 Tax=Symbiodinium microadriaticum TaxID=2951 RepID=A0A1Q9CA20_SYMMI|nr:hypothetical protein AK812_SmicGene39915 [Symbiodinium microadriaticum]